MPLTRQLASSRAKVFTVKKFKRNAEVFDTLELFSNLASQYGYDLRDPATTDDFANKVRQSIEKSKSTKTMLHGKRTESSFAYVVGALGQTVLLHQEDAGEIFYIGEDIQPPDYRLTLANGKQLFVEVKNCHDSHDDAIFKIYKKYYQKLARYSELNKVELKIAVLFSRWNVWCLLSINDFEDRGEHYQINMLSAIKQNGMAELGDLMIGTAPDLELRMLTNPDEASEIDARGKALFITRKIKIYSRGIEIENAFEKNLAFFFIRFGEWEEREYVQIVENNRLIGMRFVFSPREQVEPNFAFIGTLSKMVTIAYKGSTSENGEVTALKVGFDPSSFEIAIPSGYKGEQLPLWIFQQESRSGHL